MSKNSTKKSSPRKQEKSDAEITAGVDTWHDERYGKNRQKLTREQLEALTNRICQGGDEDTARSLMLLVDEIERAQFDRLEVASICCFVEVAAFRDTCAASDARKAFVSKAEKLLAGGVQ